MKSVQNSTNSNTSSGVLFKPYELQYFLNYNFLNLRCLSTLQSGQKCQILQCPCFEIVLARIPNID